MSSADPLASDRRAGAGRAEANAHAAAADADAADTDAAPRDAGSPSSGAAPPGADDRHDAEAERRVVTVPNVISVLRLLGSASLLVLAAHDLRFWFVGTFVVLLLSDWVDGKLAVLLHQRTVLGARLDSIGDAVLYFCLLLGLLALEPFFLREWYWLVIAMVASHLASWAASELRFGRMPAYHTRAAKMCWGLVSVAAVTLLVHGPEWPAVAALVFVILTNAQAIAITFTLPRWEADVSSWWDARRRARRLARGDEPAGEANEEADEPAAAGPAAEHPAGGRAGDARRTDATGEPDATGTPAEPDATAQPGDGDESPGVSAARRPSPRTTDPR